MLYMTVPGLISWYLLTPFTCFAHSPPPASGNHPSVLWIYELGGFCFVFRFHMQESSYSICPSLTDFPQHEVLGLHPCGCQWQNFLLFYGWIIWSLPIKAENIVHLTKPSHPKKYRTSMLWQIRDVRLLERWEEGECHVGKDRGRKRGKKTGLRKKGDGAPGEGRAGVLVAGWETRAVIRQARADALCVLCPWQLLVSARRSSAVPARPPACSCWATQRGFSSWLSNSFWTTEPFFPKMKPGMRSPHTKPIKAELLCSWEPNLWLLPPVWAAPWHPQWGFHWPRFGKYFS